MKVPPIRIVPVVLTALMLSLGGSAAQAITWGWEDDFNQYPNVGSMVVLWNDGAYYQWCSGTLIHPRVFLTAGHCVYGLQLYQSLGLVLDFFVTFDFDANTPATYLGVDGAILHPDYLSLPPSRTHWADVGALVLGEEVTAITPATLPFEGFLTDLKRAGLLTPSTQILTVGYGSTLYFPPPTVTYPPPVRRYAYSEYRAVLKSWLLVNQNPASGNGGTGYGDSGGPAFWIDPADQSLVLVGTTSWGDPNLVATTFFHRADTPRTLDFLDDVIDSLD